MMKRLVFRLLICIGSLMLFDSCAAQSTDKTVVVGAERKELYLSALKNKSVALVVNHTSKVGNQHLLDFMLEQSVHVVKVFAPEHGFRGDADAGELVGNDVDAKTGVSVVSLYGKTKKPASDDLAGIDVVVFDIQDVGCRFYTYISTMHYVMEACAENGVKMIVLDRPNPNGDYVAGPVLKPEFHSFVGMHPIPVVHGCTVGELAMMINGEGWLNHGVCADLKVIPVEGYTHDMILELPIKPSPNLPNQLAVRLYPSLCFFEATSVSVGRGTYFPFQVLGYPNGDLGSFSFTPQSIEGMASHPRHQNEQCYGIDFRALKEVPTFSFEIFIEWYNKFKNESDFLIREAWFNKLAGDDRVLAMIRQEMSSREIEQFFETERQQYLSLRKRYLLYSDF